MPTGCRLGEIPSLERDWIRGWGGNLDITEILTIAERTSGRYADAVDDCNRAHPSVGAGLNERVGAEGPRRSGATQEPSLRLVGSLRP